MSVSSRFETAERLRRALRAAAEERLAARATRDGLLTPEQLEEARRQHDDQGGSLLAILLARGWLAQAQVARLGEDDAAELAQPVRGVPLPPEAQTAAQQPDQVLGDFILCALIGRGGAGEVWKAWDRRLGRWTAVKISTAALDSASARERFQREAQAAARLAHPNIVPVFQVGTDRGRAFLVMPLVDGVSLDVAALPLRQGLEVMRTAALAVHHAHAQGIVHRDLKPGNIIVDQAGAVFVVDFGLAYVRAETASRLTRPGEVVGTASFMAPEQARGRQDDSPATAIDVYGLGATLYYLVTGRAPFVGDSFPAVVTRVMRGELDPPRQVRPTLDARVEAVVLKAMAAAPADRYSSAAALAEDLRRLLADEPIGARTPGPLRRGWQTVRRHALAAALVAVAVAGALTAGLVGARVARERRAAVESFRELAGLSLQTALRLRRAGDTAGMRQVLPRLAAAHARLGDRAAASADVEYLMGRLFRALLDDERALAHQQRALALDPSHAAALYERVVLLSKRYGSDLSEVLATLNAEGAAAGPEDGERARPDLERLRAAVLKDCGRLETLSMSSALSDSARGILAYHRRRLDEARTLLARAVAADPSLEEAWEILALTEAADGRPAEAEAVYARALAHDRGYAPYRINRCELRRWTDWAGAVEDASAALALDPDAIPARLCRGGTRTDMGHEALMQGQDPTADLDAAERDFDEVLRRRELPLALRYRGLARRYQAIHRMRRSQPAAALLDASEADHTRAIALDPRTGEHWSSRGRTRARRAELLLDTGGDPRPALDAAESDLLRAGRGHDVPPHVRAWLADARAHRALYDHRRGLDATAAFAAVEQEYRAVTVTRDHGWHHLLRGTMRLWHGRAAARAGRDPLAIWSAAEADLDRAKTELPQMVDPPLRRGLLGVDRAEWLLTHGRRATADLTGARTDLDRALSREPDNVDGLVGQARLCRLLADRRCAEVAWQRAVGLRPSLLPP